jgi:predicted MFS family arabinose efflux permease
MGHQPISHLVCYHLSSPLFKLSGSISDFPHFTTTFMTISHPDTGSLSPGSLSYGCCLLSGSQSSSVLNNKRGVRKFLSSSMLACYTGIVTVTPLGLKLCSVNFFMLCLPVCHQGCLAYLVVVASASTPPPGGGARLEL